MHKYRSGAAKQKLQQTIKTVLKAIRLAKEHVREANLEIPQEQLDALFVFIRDMLLNKPYRDQLFAVREAGLEHTEKLKAIGVIVRAYQEETGETFGMFRGERLQTGPGKDAISETIINAGGGVFALGVFGFVLDICGALGAGSVIVQGIAAATAGGGAVVQIAGMAKRGDFDEMGTEMVQGAKNIGTGLSGANDKW